MTQNRLYSVYGGDGQLLYTANYEDGIVILAKILGLRVETIDL